MASSIPGSARDFVRVVTRAVEAAISADDVATYDRAIARLTTLPGGGRVLGDVLRSLLEDTHPDGFDSGDITLVLGRCYDAAVAWLPPERVDTITLLAALASAVGVHEPGITGETGGEHREPHDATSVKPPAWPDYAYHAPLLVADLLPFAPRTLHGYIENTFADYVREAREELP